MTQPHPKPVELADREAEESSAAGALASRAWWGRIPRLVSDPVSVFEALRETDDVDVDARAEPITAIAILAGMAGVLLSPAWGRLLDDSQVDGLVVAVLTFVAGVFYGAAGYFLLGLAVWLGARGAGVDQPFRLSRQVVAFASLPIALSLFVTAPLLLAWVGGDWFRAGGDDVGAPRWIITAVALLFVGWAVGLIVVGLRTTFRLPWFGVFTALALAGVLVAACVVVPDLL
jgi:Yip1 domain